LGKISLIATSLLERERSRESEEEDDDDDGGKLFKCVCV